MAGELKKPDLVHTLWPEEIEKKMWPLPVRELFMCGRATSQKLQKININTIGDLARADKNHMALLKSQNSSLKLANGIDDSEVTLNSEIIQRSWKQYYH